MEHNHKVEYVGNMRKPCTTLSLAAQYTHKLSTSTGTKGAAYLHWIICQYYNIISSEKRYEHHPPTVTDTDEVSILWEMPIHNDR